MFKFKIHSINSKSLDNIRAKFERQMSSDNVLKKHCKIAKKEETQGTRDSFH